MVLQEGKPSSTGMGGLEALEMVRRQERSLRTATKVHRLVRVEPGWDPQRLAEIPFCL